MVRFEKIKPRFHMVYIDGVLNGAIRNWGKGGAYIFISLQYGIDSCALRTIADKIDSLNGRK